MQHDPAVPDESLRAEIMAALAVDSRTAHTGLRVGVLHGIVHLAGAADSLAERAAAETLAAQTPGVRGVVNRIAAPGAPSPTRKIDLNLKTR